MTTKKTATKRIRPARPPKELPKGKWLLRNNRPGTEGIEFR